MTRERIRSAGERVRSALGMTAPTADASSLEVLRLCDEIQYGLIWSRDTLSIRDRLVVALTVCCLLERERKLRQLTVAALENGLSASAVVEVFLQTGIYAGFAVTESAVEIARPLFAERELDIPLNDANADDLHTLERESARLRRLLHGARDNERHADPGHRFTAPLYAIATSHCYGIIWRRPGLSLRERLFCALAAFTALGTEEDMFQKFAQAAIENGIDAADLRELIMQTVPYAGFPRALSSLMLMDEVFPHDHAPGGSLPGNGHE